MVDFLVPSDAVPGDKLQVDVGGHRIAVVVPEGTTAGGLLQIEVSADGRAFNSVNDINDEGGTYTSGEDGECSFGPTMLSPDEWQRRHPKSSAFRASTRPFRTHHFHNQRDARLFSNTNFAQVLSSPIDSDHQVERVTYESVSADIQGFDRYCMGKGIPVMLTQVPGSKELTKSLCVRSLRDVENRTNIGLIPVRICKAFRWGKKKIEGRMPLQDYFQYVSQHHKADVPFYVFEDDIGGRQHTKLNYQNTDNWASEHVLPAPIEKETKTQKEEGEEKVPAEKEKEKDDTEGRHYFSDHYRIPSLFAQCMLKVPKIMRPTSTDGVLLIGCKRSGSYPHVDPSFTAA